MEMLQLRYFYESARNGSFSRTARDHQVPTTSVSAAIKRLEGELGCSLFDRTSNRIALNANGQRLLRSLCTVFAELEEAAEDLSVHGEDRREIKLLVRAMRRRITDMIVEYNAQNPHAAFRIAFDFGETAFEDYDIIIDEAGEGYSDYEKIALFSMDLRLKCASTDPIAFQRLTLNRLCGRQFLTMGIGSNMHKILTKACMEAGFTPNISVWCNDIECYEKLIASGMGIGIGREQKAGSADDAICDLKVSDFNERYTVCAYYRRKAYFGQVRSFVEFLKTKGV